MTSLSPSTLEDAQHIAEHIRDSDRQEVEALMGLPPALVLPSQLLPGRRVMTLRAGDDILGMGGDEPSLVPGLGIIWFVGTNAIDNHKAEFLRDSRHYIDELFTRYDVIGNLIDARNITHQRWLRWLGFSFLRKEAKWGAHSVPFYEFAKAKPLCASY